MPDKLLYTTYGPPLGHCDGNNCAHADDCRLLSASRRKSLGDRKFTPSVGAKVTETDRLDVMCRSFKQRRK